MAMTTETQGRQKDKLKQDKLKQDELTGTPPEASEGLDFDAASAEDRPGELLAERQAAFIQRLLTQGLIPFVPEGRPGPPPRPIPVQGRPVSETLIEERR